MLQYLFNDYVNSDLSNNNILGPMPNSLWTLRSLKTLWVHFI